MSLEVFHLLDSTFFTFYLSLHWVHFTYLFTGSLNFIFFFMMKLKIWMIVLMLYYMMRLAKYLYYNIIMNKE